MNGSAVLAAALAAGCSGSAAGIGDNSSGGAVVGAEATPGAAMFQAPTGTVTPDSIYGLWGGTLDDGNTTFDSRVRLDKGSVTFATRCTMRDGSQSSVVGVTAAARISSDSLAILESKSDATQGGVKCWVNVTPQELKRCAADVPAGFEQTCFRLAGTSLTEFGKTSLEKAELTKLSD